MRIGRAVVGRPNPRQELRRNVRCDDLARSRSKPRDQTQLARRPAHLVPGNPNAVGVSQGRLAVVLGELLRAEDIFAVGRLGRLAFQGVVVYIDGQFAVDLQRLVTHLTVEHHAAAESADTWHADLVEDRVGPDDGHPPGNPRFAIVVHPGDAIAQIELGASGQDRQGGRAK